MAKKTSLPAVLARRREIAAVDVCHGSRNINSKIPEVAENGRPPSGGLSPDEDFKAAVARYMPGLRAFLARLSMSSGPEVDDMVQETVLKALAAANTYRGEASVSTWLFSIASRVHVDNLRSRQREISARSMGVEMARGRRTERSNPVERDAERNETIRCVEKRMERLPATYHRILVYREIECRAIKEIAVLESSTPGAIKTKLNRARKALRKILESQCHVTNGKHGGPLTCTPRKSV